ncbi:hypothetical protein CLOM_g7973 [Closterium sp. NIES-68]|nr:hypothetical protein CLOM_g7973 [Closterium sp. NIES-68]
MVSHLVECVSTIARSTGSPSNRVPQSREPTNFAAPSSFRKSTCEEVTIRFASPPKIVTSRHFELDTAVMRSRLPSCWWGEKQQAAFDQLEIALTLPPVLRISNPDRPYEVITDASYIAIGVVLLQDFSDGLQPAAYELRKLQGAEKNYTVHDKEMLAIVHAFKTWWCYLTGADVIVRTDHKFLQYLRAQPNLNSQQIRWLDFLESIFHNTIIYKQGASNIADALTRPTAHTTTILITQTSPLLTGLFTHGYKIDPFFRSAIHQQHTASTEHYFNKRDTSRIWS